MANEFRIITLKLIQILIFYTIGDKIDLSLNEFLFYLFYPFSETMVVMEPALLMALFLVICLKALNRNSGALATQGGK